MKRLRELVIGGIMVLGLGTAGIGAKLDKDWMIYSGAGVAGGGALVGVILEEIYVRKENNKYKNEK